MLRLYLSGIFLCDARITLFSQSCQVRPTLGVFSPNPTGLRMQVCMRKCSLPIDTVVDPWSPSLIDRLAIFLRTVSCSSAFQSWYTVVQRKFLHFLRPPFQLFLVSLFYTSALAILGLIIIMSHERPRTIELQMLSSGATDLRPYQ